MSDTDTDTDAGADGVRVRGGASPEELAAVLAVVRAGARPASEDPYRAWRRVRRAALRRATAPRGG